MTRSIAAAAAAAVAGAATAGDPGIGAVQIADGFDRPVYVTHAPGDAGRIFVLEQEGFIRTIDLATGQVKLFMSITNVVNDSQNEQGLLGLAFHPDHFENGLFYVNYTATNPFGDTVIAQYRVLEFQGELDFERGDASSEVRLLTIDQPFSNHNGGWIDFAPPGVDEGNYLYISTGDGGSANDPGERSQDITNQLLGKMLRIDVDADDFPADPDRNYGIPANNPFVGVNGDDEIWHFGLRNAWRNAFDRETGDLLIGDVGQNAEEEVSFQAVNPAGAGPGDAGYTGGLNYGWDCLEGDNCISFDVGCSCSDPDLVLPIQTYSHAGGNCSITGGYTYRGCAIPGLEGTYFYADVCSNQIWSFETDGVNIFNFTNRTAELNPPGPDSISSIVSFGEDAFGEIYICDLFGGEIFKIIPDVTPPDKNGNGIPDACEPPACAADLDGDGGVGSADLNAVLGAFGLSDAGDTDGDGDTDSDDLNAILAFFGQSCP